MTGEYTAIFAALGKDIAGRYSLETFSETPFGRLRRSDMAEGSIGELSHCTALSEELSLIDILSGPGRGLSDALPT